MKRLTYLFDFDGTLVDSMPCWSQKMISVLKKNNIVYPENIIEIITPLGDVGAAKYFIENFGLKQSVEQIIWHMDEYAYPEYHDHIGLKDGVFEYLVSLREKNCSLNVLTASPHKMLDPCLKRNRIYDFFDNIWSCDDFGLTKADVQIYKEALKIIGAKPEETIFFDDNIGAIQTAKQAGLYTIAVYDESAKRFSEKLKDIADAYIWSFDELNPR